MFKSFFSTTTATSVGQWLRFASSGALVSGLSLTVAHPFEQVAGINPNCRESQKPAALILEVQEAQATNFMECQIVIAAYE